MVDAGSVQIVRVGKSKLSFPSPSITENSLGTPGEVQADSRFGTTVSGVPGWAGPLKLGAAEKINGAPSGQPVIDAGPVDLTAIRWNPAVRVAKIR